VPQTAETTDAHPFTLESAMTRPTIACLALVLLSSGHALAQQPTTIRQPVVTTIDRPPVTQLPATLSTAFAQPPLTNPPTTPEMWFYSQEQRRHDDPALAVRRKAELQAEQRMARIASQKWYGYSNSRPEASITPIMGSYSAGWVGNSWNRYEWTAGGYYYLY
jgi:hypothetical protein